MLGLGQRGRSCSSQAKLRPADAIARWARLRIQPSASSGHASCSSTVVEQHELADREVAVDHVAPAEQSTAAIESVGRK